MLLIDSSKVSSEPVFHYHVPVIVEVELSTNEILSVHIDDEAIDGPLRVTDDEDHPVKPKKESRAIHIAETQIWPGWITGY